MTPFGVSMPPRPSNLSLRCVGVSNPPRTPWCRRTTGAVCRLGVSTHRDAPTHRDSRDSRDSRPEPYRLPTFSSLKRVDPEARGCNGGIQCSGIEITTPRNLDAICGALFPRLADGAVVVCVAAAGHAHAHIWQLGGRFARDRRLGEPTLSRSPQGKTSGRTPLEARESHRANRHHAHASQNMGSAKVVP